MRIDPQDQSFPTLDTCQPAVGRRRLLAGALGLAVGAVIGTASVDTAEAAGYYYVKQWKLSGTNIYIALYKKSGVNKWRTKIFRTGGTYRYFYIRASYIRASGTKYAVDTSADFGQDSGYAYFTGNRGETFELYGSVKAKKGDKHRLAYKTVTYRIP